MKYLKETKLIKNANFGREKNILGWITKDEETGKYDGHNANDHGNFSLDDDIEMNVEAKVIMMPEGDDGFGKGGYILEFSSKDTGLENPDDLVSLEQAIEEIHNCGSGLEEQIKAKKSSKGRTSKK